MHSVIRKRQGIPYNPEEPKGLFANASHLAAVQSRAQPFEPDELGLAYGARQYAKLVRQCVDVDSALRNRALQHVIEQVRYARETASFLPAGLVTSLNVSAEHTTDVTTRTLATAALARLSLEGNGREHMLLPGPSASVPALLRLVIDNEAAVRCNALSCALRLGKYAAGATALVDGGAIGLLIERCTSETAELLPHVLAALEAAMMNDHVNAAASRTRQPSQRLCSDRRVLSASWRRRVWRRRSR